MHEEHTGLPDSGALTSPLSLSLDASSDNSMSRSPVPNTIAEAFERKLREQRIQAAAAAGPTEYSNFDENHERRQEFRRLIDPGIMRPNPRHIALDSLQVHDTYVCVVQENDPPLVDVVNTRRECFKAPQ